VPLARLSVIERVAVIADVHGVLPALEAVLAEPDVRAADLVVVCGDVAAGPLPRETVEALWGGLGGRIRGVRGNADRELVALARGQRTPGAPDPLAAWAAAQLTSNQVDLLAKLPTTVELELAELGATTFCHGTPRADDESLVVDSPRHAWVEALAGLAQNVRAVVCGHTHMPFVRLVAGRVVVNPGSVGMPYGTAGAHWALLGRGVGVSLRRTPCDVERAAQRILADSSFPGVSHFVDGYLRAPPSDMDALDAFAPRSRT
jgi:putative phosphoesterase